MRAGSLRHRISLLAPTKATGTYGGATDTWNVAVSALAANVRDTVGTNYYQADQEKNKGSSEVRIRWRSDVKRTWRVLFGLRTLEIIHIADPDGRQSDMILFCKEIT